MLHCYFCLFVIILFVTLCHVMLFCYVACFLVYLTYVQFDYIVCSEVEKECNTDTALFSAVKHNTALSTDSVARLPL